MLTPSSERAFTLIELAVAMFVTAIVLAIFVSLVKETATRTSDADAASVSAAKLSEGLDRLSDDVRAARAPLRAEIDQVSTRDELRTGFAADPVGHGDIAHASGSTLAMWTDADADPAGPRCATYSIEQVQQAKLVWALVRRSGTPGGACPASAATPLEVLTPLGEQQPAVDIFHYGTMESTGPDECALAKQSPGAQTLDAHQRLRIVSVDIDLGSVGERAGKSRTNDGRSAIDLWSRLNDDYYYAIGCAQ